MNEIIWSERYSIRERSEKRRNEKETKNVRIVAWNVARAERLTQDEWKYLKKFDMICLSGTWMERKDRAWSEKQLSEYYCEMRDAREEGSKGRASGGLLCAIRKEYKVGGDLIEQKGKR
ncbi:hypothetical protein QAD02_002996 [Eretmocerus hayati]|uniref:Uncharacterized protein n=1 Tax=Eretmocerus hayati TaxID=131215 RepID=A0ACC2NKW9_9HYME|nr:hypothetical protein QAD02_002996 [Eretmocerus hayati]